MMHQIYLVTASGYYPLIQGSIPTRDVWLLEEIKVLVSSIKPGTGKTSEIIIAECDDSSMPTESSKAYISSLSNDLYEKAGGRVEYTLHHSV